MVEIYKKSRVIFVYTAFYILVASLTLLRIRRFRNFNKIRNKINISVLYSYQGNYVLDFISFSEEMDLTTKPPLIR